MTNTAVQQAGLSQELQNVSAAWRELGTTTRQLIIALFSKLTQRQPACPVQTARQEADKLRAYADSLYRADPRYAQDLYAAATRHERSAANQ